MSCCVLLTLNFPVGVISFASLITAFSLRVLSSTMTIADCWFFALHTENHTSSPPACYSGCTTRFAPSPTCAHSAIGSTSKPLSRLLMSYTATDWLIFGSGLSAVSTHRFFDFGCVLMNSEPPPCPFSVRTTFHALSLCFFGSVPITEIVSSPRWPVDHTGPYFG